MDHFKRIFDVFAAAIALLCASPLLLAIALLVRLKLGSPVFFRQRRPGLGGKSFLLIKFRTMTDARDANGDLLPDGDRLTRFGAWLRATSIDELPELLNVLRGDMSLVGPRPLLEDYLPLYTPRQARRHEVRPGLTGLAQVSGRNATTWEKRLDLDVAYVDNRNLLLDLKIILRTIAIVLKRDGISAADHATMPRFDSAEDR